MTVAVYTLGCKVNIYESEFVISLLKKNNYEIVDFNEKADIYIINTCSVTNESDKKNRKIINEAKRKNSNAIIVVMGCYSQVNPDLIEADIVIGSPVANRSMLKNNNIIGMFVNNLAFRAKILPDQTVSKFLKYVILS